MSRWKPGEEEGLSAFSRFRPYDLGVIDAFQRFLLYGCLGLLVEVFFTGTASLLRKNWRATSQTYLWMLPIYGFAGLALEAVHDALHWHPVVMALIYIPLIYGFEFGSGWILRRLLGRCPWDYGVSKYSVMGLIRLDYMPYWFLLALAFTPASYVVKGMTRYFPTLLAQIAP